MNMSLFLVACFALLPAYMAEVDFHCPVDHDTKYETGEAVTVLNVTGKVYVSGTGFKADVFQAVPYATQERFELSEMVTDHSTRVDGTKTQAVCHQFQMVPGFVDDTIFAGMEETEDCLLLSILTPHERVGAPLPVIVWIHGGGFVMGAGNLQRMDGLVDNYVSRGIVFVTVQYRLGPLGFLHREWGPNNLGLYDQRTAVEYVRAYIGAFGGDPAQITLMGESAGSMSVSYLHTNMPAPTVRGSIMMSGTQLLGEDTGSMVAGARAFAQELGCANSSDVACLRAFDARRLQAAALAIRSPVSVALQFAPVPDGDMVWPNRSASIGRHRGSVIMGVTTDEFAVFLSLPHIIATKAAAALEAKRRAFVSEQLLPALFNNSRFMLFVSGGNSEEIAELLEAKLELYEQRVAANRTEGFAKEEMAPALFNNTKIPIQYMLYLSAEREQLVVLEVLGDKLKEYEVAAGLAQMNAMRQQMARAKPDRAMVQSTALAILAGMPHVDRPELAARLVLDRYLDGADDLDATNPSDIARAVADITSDTMFVAPALKEARLAAANADNKVWLYEFAMYRPEMYVTPPGAKIRGAWHSSDLVYAFSTVVRMGVYNASYRFDAADCRAAERFSSAIVDFAKTGDMAESARYADWPKVAAGDGGHAYMRFDEAATVGQAFRKSTDSFWNELLPDLGEHCA